LLTIRQFKQLAHCRRHFSIAVQALKNKPIAINIFWNWSPAVNLGAVLLNISTLDIQLKSMNTLTVTSGLRNAFKQSVQAMPFGRVHAVPLVTYGLLLTTFELRTFIRRCRDW